MALGPEKKWTALLMLVHILQGLEGTLFAVELRNAIDCAVYGQRREFWVHLCLLGALVLSAIFLYSFGWYWEQKGMALVEKRLRSYVFAQLLRRSYPHVTAVHSGEWMTRLTADTDVVVGTLLSVIPKLGGMVIQIVSALISLYLMLPQAAYFLLPAGAVLMALSILLRKRLRDSFKEVKQADGRARSFMQERLTSMMVVRAFTQEKRTSRQADELMDELAEIRLRRSRFAAVCSFGAYSVMRGGYFLGVILCGFQILNGRMSYGTMAAVLQLINRVDGPIADLSDFVLKCFAMFASVERLMEIEAYPLDCREEPQELKAAQEYYANRFAALGLRCATFSYPGGSPVISEFDLELSKGEYMAFVGESGHGKSTVLKLLMSFYSLQEGQAYLRDTDGEEQPLDAAWRALFAYVPQGNFLHSGTIRQVITFGDPDLMRQEENIWQVLKVACADGFVRELPLGLDTPLGERGAGLSEGQMQRIAIARALMSAHPILLLDESTSALDAETERKLLLNLRTMTDRTVILVTHRPAALAICEKKVVFA